MRLLCTALGLTLLAACASPPRRTLDRGAPEMEVSGGDATTPSLELRSLQPFGEQGELPMQLLEAGPGRWMVLTSRAAYLLSSEGQVLQRTVWPATSSGTFAAVTSAAWDGAGLGVALRWAGDETRAAGSYFVLGDGQGALSPSSWVSLGPPVGAPRAAWNGETYQAVWSALSGEGLDLHLTRVAPGGEPSSRILVGGISPDSTLEDWIAPAGSPAALCTIELGNRVVLRRFEAAGPSPTVELTGAERRAASPCRLASSGRSVLVCSQTRGLAPEPPDGGAAPDRGLKSLSFDTPVFQLVSPESTTLPSPVRWSAFDGTVRLDGVLWRGSRYLALLSWVGYRGGRLVLAALDEAGRVLARDLLLPLPYEPGELLGARLAATPDDLVVVFIVRRPWDEGRLYLARLTPRGL